MPHRIIAPNSDTGMAVVDTSFGSGFHIIPGTTTAAATAVVATVTVHSFGAVADCLQVPGSLVRLE